MKLYCLGSLKFIFKTLSALCISRLFPTVNFFLIHPVYCQFGLLVLNKELVSSFCLLESVLVVQLCMQLTIN